MLYKKCKVIKILVDLKLNNIQHQLIMKPKFTRCNEKYHSACMKCMLGELCDRTYITTSGVIKNTGGVDIRFICRILSQ